MSKFQIFKGTNQQFYFRLKSANGEIILASEGYASKDSCKKGIASVSTNAPDDSRYDRIDKPDNYRFNLKAGNGEIIGTSESYTTKQGRENGIQSVKNNAPKATVEDLT